MAEGLALAASVVAVLQITNSVISVCYDYSAAAKGASWQLNRITTELESLRNVLQQLEPLAKQAEFVPDSTDTKLPAFTRLCKSDGLLQFCAAEINKLDKKLKTPSWCDGFGPRRKALVQVLRWPLKETDTEKALKQIGRFRDTLTFAITADDVALSLEIQRLLQSANDAISDPKHGLKSIQQANLDTQQKVDSVMGFISDMDNRIEAGQLEIRRKAIYKWLSAPDPSTNYNRGRRSRQANTGIWFINSEEFRNSREISPKQRVRAGVLFFDFNDLAKQKPEHMVRALIAQLFTHAAETFAPLESLYLTCTEEQRQPDVENLMAVLKTIVCEATDTYILVDALDECSSVHDLLGILVEIGGWKVPHLHILLTSRRLAAIEDTLENLVDRRHQIDIHSKVVDKDISIYVHDRLLVDPGLRRWRNNSNVQEEIRSALTGKADGMFRWAACQLDTLRHCPNLPMLRNALKSLPKTLDETYARILCDIPEEYMRPLRLYELAEVVAVDINGYPWFNETARFPDGKDLLAICSSLVKIDADDNHISFDESVISLAHFSVKEYLVSNRIQNQKAANYFLQEFQSHGYIAASCLAYLLSLDVWTPRQDEWRRISASELRPVFDARPLLLYAAEYWVVHARNLGLQVEILLRLSKEFLDPDRLPYSAWVYIWSSPAIWVSESNDFDFRRAPSLWLMAFHGVIGIVQQLLNEGADVNERSPEGAGGTALWAASRSNWQEVAECLLQHGAKVDVEHEEQGTPLQAACFRDYVGIAKALIDDGADVNHACRYYGTPLRAAVQWCDRPKIDLVRLLTSAGAEVDFQDGEQFQKWGSVLIQACARKSRDIYSIVKHLLEAGAEVNLRGGRCDTVLQTVCATQRTDMGLVELLLEKGAQVNAVGGRYGTALEAACSYHENSGVVKLLLEKGADINLQGGKYGTPLQAVCAEDHDNVDQMALLLENGAKIDAQGGKYGTALQAACSRTNPRILKFLLKEGADTTVIGGKYGSAIHAACAVKENLETLDILLEAGLDVDIDAHPFGTPLQAACQHNGTDVISMLLDNGADVKARTERGTALQAALDMRSSNRVIHLLLAYGAEEDGLSDQQLVDLEKVKRS